ncbi:MAG: hypothetical protein L6R40_000680 [Gallowayella cf. fulva]|nr:MAG: hypothetical protein L6R40_000680 [Xanthomendoza cf. fulva]
MLQTILRTSTGKDGLEEEKGEFLTNEMEASNHNIRTIDRIIDTILQSTDTTTSLLGRLREARITPPLTTLSAPIASILSNIHQTQESPTLNNSILQQIPLITNPITQILIRLHSGLAGL